MFTREDLKPQVIMKAENVQIQKECFWGGDINDGDYWEDVTFAVYVKNHNIVMGTYVGLEWDFVKSYKTLADAEKLFKKIVDRNNGVGIAFVG